MTNFYNLIVTKKYDKHFNIFDSSATETVHLILNIKFAKWNNKSVCLAAHVKYVTTVKTLNTENSRALKFCSHFRVISEFRGFNL